MLMEFGTVFTFLAFAVVAIIVLLTLGRLLRPHNPDPEKNSVYECGEVPVGGGVVQFNMRFYLIAFLFVIFDVEIALIYPVSAIFKDLLHDGWGVLAFVEITVFVLVLMAGFVYAWSQGCLDWVRSLSNDAE
ncbi:MAG: NAD(P)H-quinone oxidoreductase subunit 3 [Proteobacteria bacterium]|nr:NAD(P)H-quinone oxidoreductase subunit 3 [Pseudomonadota bacterium]